MSFEIVGPKAIPDREIVLVRAVQTCVAFPSQWNAWDADGQYYYLRHRAGRGSVDAFDSPDYTRWGGDPLGKIAAFVGELPGDDFTAARNDLEAFCEMAGIILAQDAEIVSYREYYKAEVKRYGL
jgi:hypothetical protein